MIEGYFWNIEIVRQFINMLGLHGLVVSDWGITSQ
jgi:hypothetical protein